MKMDEEEEEFHQQHLNPTRHIQFSYISNFWFFSVIIYKLNFPYISFFYSYES